MKETLKNNGYESQIFYNVIIRGGAYKGWRTSYVGLGRMTFRNNKNEIIETIEGKYGDADWMKQCWEQFLNKVWIKEACLILREEV